MPNKIPSEIKKINLNDATFSGSEIEPTLVNFFYGNNGSGKSTIGRAIKGGDDVKSQITWLDGKSSSDYRILVYNQDYISKLIDNVGNLPGVFTFHTADDEQIELQIGDLEHQKKTFNEKLEKANRRLSELNEVNKGRSFAYREIIWQTTDKVRQRFSPYISGLQRNKDSLMETILHTTPNEYNLDELENLCIAAFDKNAKTYDPFHFIKVPEKIREIESSDLLHRKIVSRSETPFAEYMKAIRATSWVKEGHKMFAEHKDGKCPYCQQPLPDDFEAQIAACFDSHYQEEVQQLQMMLDEYIRFTNDVSEKLESDMNSRNGTILVESFSSYASVIVGTLESNCNLLEKKIADPSIEIEMKEYDSFVELLNREVHDYNSLIEKNNAFVINKRDGKKNCEAALQAHLTYMVYDSVQKYLEENEAHKHLVEQAQRDKNNAERDVSSFQEQIDGLRSQIGNTIDSMKSINTILDDTGFQGFRLAENPTIKNHYHLIRPGQNTDEPATNLSEGERNFIAFLYFYHQVKGSNTKTNEKPEKIVVIDDPVSSMDSQVLFVVGALVRELIEICLNNVRERTPLTENDYIKQIFLLTHNTYYHREITYGYLLNYEAVSFFRIHKENNVSDVEFCTQWHPLRESELMNRNPVENSYATLWREYLEVKSCTSLMSVIRRILEYYFLQLCCYDGLNLRKTILEKHREDFKKADGSFDSRNHRLASSMLAYIHAESIGFNDGIDYVHEGYDPDKMRETFRLIFHILKQDQHYDMMIANTLVK